MSAIRIARCPAARAGPDSPLREVIANKDVRTLAKDVLPMSRDELSAAFRKSPMKRAKLAEPQRNARVVLGNAGASADTADVLASSKRPSPELARQLPHPSGQFPSFGRRAMQHWLEPLADGVVLAVTSARWRLCYDQALVRRGEADIPTRANPEAGARALPTRKMRGRHVASARPEN